VCANGSPHVKTGCRSGKRNFCGFVHDLVKSRKNVIGEIVFQPLHRRPWAARPLAKRLIALLLLKGVVKQTRAYVLLLQIAGGAEYAAKHATSFAKAQHRSFAAIAAIRRVDGCSIVHLRHFKPLLLGASGFFQ